MEDVMKNVKPTIVGRIEKKRSAEYIMKEIDW